MWHLALSNIMRFVLRWFDEIRCVWITPNLIIRQNSTYLALSSKSKSQVNWTHRTWKRKVLERVKCVDVVREASILSHNLLTLHTWHSTISCILRKQLNVDYREKCVTINSDGDWLHVNSGDITDESDQMNYIEGGWVQEGDIHVIN